MRALESSIPPVAVVLLVALIMWVICWVSPAFAFDTKWREPIAVCFAMAGAVTSIAGVLSFRRAGTTVNPTRVSSPSSLVVSGVYKLTRNPRCIWVFCSSWRRGHFSFPTALPG